MSVLLNSSPEGFFACSCGVRHGDSLSPIFFCLAEDFLCRYIVPLVKEGSITHISSPRGVFGSFLLFFGECKFYLSNLYIQIESQSSYTVLASPKLPIPGTLAHYNVSPQPKIKVLLVDYQLDHSTKNVVD